MSRHITVTEEDRSVARYDLINQSNTYLREVEEHHNNGHRPATCFHGTSLWTDYDNICGPCEDSQFDPRWHAIGSEEFNDTVEEIARRIARDNRFDLILRMIKEDSKEVNTRSELLHLKTLINVALDV